jgi:exonuclease VII small subunit
MGGYNPRKAEEVEATIRELEKLAQRLKKDKGDLDKAIKSFKSILRDLKQKEKK